MSSYHTSKLVLEVLEGWHHLSCHRRASLQKAAFPQLTNALFIADLPHLRALHLRFGHLITPLDRDNFDSEPDDLQWVPTWKCPQLEELVLVGHGESLNSHYMETHKRLCACVSFQADVFFYLWRFLPSLG